MKDRHVPDASRWLSIEEASQRLGVRAKTLRTKANQAALGAHKGFSRGRNRLLFDAEKVEKVRHRMSAAVKDCDRNVDIGFTLPRDFGTEEASLGGLQDYYCFSAVPTSPNLLPAFDLPPVTLEDLHLFAFVSRKEETRDAIRRQISQRLQGHPDGFRVRFFLDPDATEKTLRAAVRKAARAIAMNPDDAVFQDHEDVTVCALMERVVPNMRNVENLETYLIQTAKNELRSECRRRERALEEATAFERETVFDRAEFIREHGGSPKPKGSAATEDGASDDEGIDDDPPGDA